MTNGTDPALTQFIGYGPENDEPLWRGRPARVETTVLEHWIVVFVVAKNPTAQICVVDVRRHSPCSNSSAFSLSSLSARSYSA